MNNILVPVLRYTNLFDQPFSGFSKIVFRRFLRAPAIFLKFLKILARSRGDLARILRNFKNIAGARRNLRKTIFELGNQKKHAYITNLKKNIFCQFLIKALEYVKFKTSQKLDFGPF